MAEQTVKQLAGTINVELDRLLQQMKEAGLSQLSQDDVVSDEDKKTLLSHLRGNEQGQAVAPSKITLKRRTLGTLKTNKSGQRVKVEMRKKRTYVKRASLDEQEQDKKSEDQAALQSGSQLEQEAEIIRREDASRKETEQAEKREIERKKREAEQRQLAEKEAIEKAELEARLQQEKEERERIEQEKTERESVRAENKEKVASEPEADLEAQAAEAAAKAQAEAQAAERGGQKHRKEKPKGRPDDRQAESFSGANRRRELSLKKESRRSKRRRPKISQIQVEQQGGEFSKPAEVIKREIELGDTIAVGGLAQQMSIKAGEVIKVLMGMGVMATINQVLDQDTAILVIEEMGYSYRVIANDQIEHDLQASLVVEEGQESTRSAVITVMGHVDHGKTSLLDYIRKTRVVADEAGGITQHIGAYHVDTGHGNITFLDTPGHAAFTAMRARGAKTTDIVVLVCASDDGVMPQTEEAVQHAKAADVPLVVAVNKIDLEGADPDRVRNELAALDVIPEDWGGDTQFVNVSAETGEGINELLEALVLQSEILELKSVVDAPGRGVVVESQLDKGRGPVATLLVQNGTLNVGDTLVAGEFYGKVRALVSDKGDSVLSAGPSIPVEMLGLNGTPQAGDDFSVAADDKNAREVAEFRLQKNQEQRQALQQAARLDNMFSDIGHGDKRVLKLVLKADVRGSLEAIIQSCANIGNEEVSVNILGSGVGGISESDATMAVTYGAVIFGFNVRPDRTAKSLIEKEGIDTRYYSVIYELLDDIKAVLQDMLAPEVREDIIGTAEVRDVFRSPRYGQVAGCMVTEGTISRNKKIRVLRDNVVIFEGELESLRRFKDDVNEVRNGLECGIGVRNYNDVHAGDQIEVFDVREVARTL